MILLLHRHSKEVVKVLYNQEVINFNGTNLVETFWWCAEKFPEKIIVWCEEELEQRLNFNAIPEFFHHDLIMVSYGIRSSFLPDAIGYVDQLPFINFNRNVHYATWLMSSDVGGITGKILLRFKKIFRHIREFSMLLNSIAKLGQQNGLFCYSAPALVKGEERPVQYFGGSSYPKTEMTRSNLLAYTNTASKGDLFSFVHSHYKSVRLLILFWCLIRYEKEFALLPLLNSFRSKKLFQKTVDFSGIEICSGNNFGIGETIDVIIPTLGRREYLLQVMEDLKEQTKMPQKVIVVEQNPNSEATSELPELENWEWPFKVVHYFTHQAGACSARNLALADVTSDWVFFADDDIRLKRELLENCLDEVKRLRISCLNMNCKQKGELTVFSGIKQWGSFGSGTSFVNATFCKKLQFDEVFEYGFGEDIDYGMQLRNAGCDIIYHPEIEILHLKAPRGGFREMLSLPWDLDQPKPAPTLMVFMKKYYSPEQQRGYKTELFLRYYNKQSVKNPANYLKLMRRRWEKSEEWAYRLFKRKNNANISDFV